MMFMLLEPLMNAHLFMPNAHLTNGLEPSFYQLIRVHCLSLSITKGICIA